MPDDRTPRRRALDYVLVRVLSGREHHSPAAVMVDAADAIEAAGWRPPARAIDSIDELDALPDDTIIRTCYGTAAQKVDEAWEIPNEIGRCLSEAIDLPATVVDEPMESSA